MTENAKFYKNENNKIICTLCPRECKISENNAVFCKVRKIINGRLHSETYENPASIAIDPIEKKPLYHFLPNTRITSLGTYGCNLACNACQNWQLATNHNPPPPQKIPAQKIVDYAVQSKTPSIAYTYNEPTVFAEYLIDIAKIAKQNNIRNVIVSNGFTHPTALPEIYKNIDAANIDLKALSDDFYKSYANARLEPVLHTLRFIKNETPAHLEITTLIIPGLNDQNHQIARLADWIATNLGPEIPLHLSAYFPNHKSTTPPTEPETLHRAKNIAQNAGLQYVYLGNIPENADTICPNCKTTLITRSLWQTEILNINNAKCNNCNYTIYGNFQN